MKTQFKVSILFGEKAINEYEGDIDLSAKNAANQACGEYCHYYFDTETEKDAFILGISNIGTWDGYKVIQEDC